MVVRAPGKVPNSLGTKRISSLMCTPSAVRYATTSPGLTIIKVLTFVTYLLLILGNRLKQAQDYPGPSAPPTPRVFQYDRKS